MFRKNSDEKQSDSTKEKECYMLKTKPALSNKKKGSAKGKPTKAESLVDRTICDGNVVLFRRNNSTK